MYMCILSIAVVYNSLFSNVLMRTICVLRFFAKNIFLFAFCLGTGGIRKVRGVGG